MASLPPGFGSFRSPDVEVLVRQSESEYEAPAVLPVVADRLRQLTGCPPPPYGMPMRLAWFNLDPTWVFINHGAFGATLKVATETRRAWEDYMEQQPLRFLDREIMPRLVWATRRLAAFVGADAQDVALVPNVTTGLNAVLQSFPLVQGDRVVSLDIGYGGVKKMLKYVCAQRGAVHDELVVPLPLRDEQVVLDLVRAYLEQRKDVKLAVFDVITSNSAILLPYAALVKLCHAHGVLALVDGAHALGHVPLDLRALGADFFVSNAHKWLCAPKGAAFLHVARAHHGKVYPLTVSHGFGAGFVSQFVWTGLKDYGPFLAIPTAIDVWQHAGFDATRQHMRDLLLSAVQLLLACWHTDAVAPLSMTRCMACVRVPGPEFAQNDNEHNEIQDRLFHEFKIEVPLKRLANRLYVRISAHVYNELQQYQALADAMLIIRPLRAAARL